MCVQKSLYPEALRSSPRPNPRKVKLGVRPERARTLQGRFFSGELHRESAQFSTRGGADSYYVNRTFFEAFVKQKLCFRLSIRNVL